jgi:hypothetical protein
MMSARSFDLVSPATPRPQERSKQQQVRCRRRYPPPLKSAAEQDESSMRRTVTWRKALAALPGDAAPCARACVATTEVHMRSLQAHDTGLRRGRRLRQAEVSEQFVLANGLPSKAIVGEKVSIVFFCSAGCNLNEVPVNCCERA